MTSAELQELVDASEITDVRFFKVEASFDVDVMPDVADDEAASYTVEFGFRMTSRGDDAGIIASMTCEVTRPGIRYFVEVAALYDVAGWKDDSYSTETVQEFGDRVGMYQLLPFAREGIADLATRLRLPVPILPLMPRDIGPGDLAAESAEPESQPPETVAGDPVG